MKDFFVHRIPRSLLISISLCCATLLAHAQNGLVEIRLGAPITAAAVSPNGKYVAVNLEHSLQMPDGRWRILESLEVLDLSASKVIAKVNIPSGTKVVNTPAVPPEGFVGYCDRGKYLVDFDLKNTVYVLNSRSYRVESTFGLGDMLGAEAGIGFDVTMACAAAAPTFVVDGYGGRLGMGVMRVYDIASGEEVGELRQTPATDERFGKIAISPNASKIAILLKKHRWSGNGRIEIRDGKTLRTITELPTGDSSWDLAFAGESEVVTVGNKTGRWFTKQAIHVWGVRSGKEERRLADTHFDVVGPISSSVNGEYILGSVIKYHWCVFCNGGEGSVDVKKQRIAVWDRQTGAEVFRSDPYGPIVPLLNPSTALSQDGSTVMAYWPPSSITPLLFPTHLNRPVRAAKNSSSVAPLKLRFR